MTGSADGAERHDDRPHVAIVGGGAGGLELAIRLSKDSDRDGGARVTLIDCSPTHLWKPRLHEIATGVMIAADERLSFFELAARHGFDFVLGGLSGVDPTAKRITVAEVTARDGRITSDDGILLPERTIDYDVAVLAVGSTSNDFGTPGVREFCHTLDSARGADQIYDGLRALSARVAARRATNVRVVIVGAGLTGVEFAAELRNAWRREPELTSLMRHDQMEVTLLDMADRPLPGSPEPMSIYARRMLQAYGVKMRFGAKVTGVEAGKVRLGDGSELSADMIVWVSGIQGPSILLAIPGLRIDRGNRVRVDATLGVTGSDGRVIDGLFAIGDCAACYEEGATKPTPATAQAASQQASHLAKSLTGHLAGGDLRPFRYTYRGTIASLGHAAIGDVPLARGRGFGISGFAARSAYAALYRSHLAICIGWCRTMIISLSNGLRRRAKPRIKLRW